jgi:hypothetical protein
MHREASIDIQASPEAVYDLVSDLPRMGEWSPENIGGEWQGGGNGQVGDRFLGHNRAGERVWSVPVMVTMAERGRCFAFVTHPDEGPYVRWTYHLEPSGTGTRVTETWDVEQLSPRRRRQTQAQLDERARYTEGMLVTTLAALKATAEADPPRHRRPKYHPSAPWHTAERARMPCRPRPEAEKEPPRGDTTQRVRTIERWLQHAEDELLYAPDAQGETAAALLDAPRYYLCRGAGGMEVLAILRFPMDARHPVAQTPYGAYAVGEVFPFTFQGQWYQGRVIERLVSRADGRVELHVQTALASPAGCRSPWRPAGRPIRAG